MITVGETLISQYANSPVICRLIRRFDDCIDPRTAQQRFYDNLWNVSTSPGFRLEVCGAVFGTEREIMISAQDEYIGFAQGFTPFGSGVWSTGEGLERRYRLDDDTYRRVIMLKAMSNIIYATAPHINRLLREMFGTRGRAYFVKNGTMAARYVFEFYLLPVERAIIRQSDLLPRPSGVLLDFYEPEADKTFGYIEANLAPFGEGAFFMGV